MTEKNARDRGLEFTGVYGRDQDEVRNRAETMKRNGYKVMVVRVPDSPYSRGIIGVGYSVYAEKKYFNDQQAASDRKFIEGAAVRYAHMKQEYELAVLKLDGQVAERVQWLKDNGYSM